MARWRWFLQRPGQDFDPVGPATIYSAGRGAYAPGGAPSEDPAWNAPTVIEGRVFMTRGQECGYRVEARRGA